MKREIIKTEDGSSSLFIPELDEHYHSTHGAIQESMHVFIETGLMHTDKSELSVFEMGYGTGLNMMLTFLHAGGRKVNYYGIEAYPLSMEEVDQLNYPDLLNLPEEQKEIFKNFHRAEKEIALSDTFIAHKTQGKLADYAPETTVDLIYFDAFAPDVQPKLWEQPVFEKMFSMLNPGGILTTYCAKGVVRRTMQACSFTVERLPGPPGKREIIRATKP